MILIKLLIIGSRNIKHFDFSNYVPKSAELIISGGASGIDSLAEAYADEHRISKLIVYPNYKRYAKGAPLKRNEIMVDNADAVLAIWDGVSRGTLHTVKYAISTEKPLLLLKSVGGKYEIEKEYLYTSML